MLSIELFVLHEGDDLRIDLLNKAARRSSCQLCLKFNLQSIGVRSGDIGRNRCNVGSNALSLERVILFGVYVPKLKINV